MMKTMKAWRLRRLYPWFLMHHSHHRKLHELLSTSYAHLVLDDTCSGDDDELIQKRQRLT